MVAGRKGFERLKRAADNVLNAETKFLFADCERSVDGKATVSLMDEARPLWAFKPIVKKAETKVLEHSVLVPPMDLARSAGNKNAQSADLEDAVFEEEAMDLLEWLDLAMLPSPRVAVGDGIDPFLSRYAVPGTELGETEEQDVVCVSWRGFLPSDWVRDVLTLWLYVDCIACWVSTFLSGRLIRILQERRSEGIIPLVCNEWSPLSHCSGRCKAWLDSAATTRREFPCARKGQ